jgi:hypothetical protein
MVEAVQTTVSPAGIWAIVIVAVVLLAFWLTAITLADRSQVRASGRARMASEIGPAPNGPWADGSASGEQATQIQEEAAHEPIGRHTVPTQRTGDTDRAAGSYAAPAPLDGGKQTPRP